jgi:hypothetical protein
MNTLFYNVFSKYSLLIVMFLSFFTGNSQTYNMTTGTVTTCSGTFYDNGGASGNFTNGQNITETFLSATGDRLKFDFTSMSNLNAASLTIYDGPTNAYPVISTPATGTFSVESTGSSLTFQFYSPSGSFTTYAGWEANISCTTSTLSTYNMSAGTVTACSGVFFDPAGPAANYVNSNITTQTFSSGSSDFINFSFTNFDVAIGDTLFAYDGTSVSAPLIGKYTGIRLPEVISSRTGSSVTFRFATNNTTVASGWKAMIACSISPVVPAIYNMQDGVRSVCSGTFYDNGGASGNFTNGQNITETFTSISGSRLKFDFTSMSNLNAASLTIYDGPTASYPVISVPATGTFSVESTGSSLTFQFYSQSGSFTTYAGWEANITCTTPTLTPYTMSTGSVTTCSGVFFDPAGPATNYANSNITTQTFSSGSANFINFTFTNFDVAIGDTLFAYDGTSVSAPLIGKYTGNRLPEIISSRTGSDVTFRFSTNNTTVASGWKALIACSATPVVPTIFNMQDGVRSVCSGTFYDNGGSAGNFTNGQNITETFVSSTGSRLKFDFTSMSNLNAASLTIYDGPSAAYPVIQRPATGTFSVESTGSSLTFQFYSQSGSFTTYAGWEANITCTTPTLTPYTMSAGTVTACSGVFFDPAGPAINYANSNITTQTFSSGSANFINFTFTNFDVAIGDTLFAYDGTSISAPLIGKYIGSRLPEVISSRTGSDVTFRFSTNNTTVASGWKAVIACSAAPVIPTIFNMQDGVRSVCSGTFYDNGGASGNFTNGQNITETFVSSTGSRLKFDFTAMSNLNAASLKIYDGPTTASPLIGTFGGTTFSVQSTGSFLTFQFYSQSGSFTTYAGWEANISCVSTAAIPVASFSTSTYTICSGSCINYTDLTTNSPTAWNWQFQGAAISSSTVQNPTGICYNTAGTYTVSLTASNGSGSSAATQTITVLAAPGVSISPSTATICQGQSVTLTASGATTYTWSTGSTSNSITVSPFSSSSYTVTSSTGNGCPTSVARLVVVRTVPVLFIGGSTVACPGQSVTLTASGASTYTWSTGATSNSITVSPTLPTTYTVTGQGSNGCTGDATQTVTIGSPANVSIAGAGTVCAGQPLVLNASGATSYTWSTGSTSTSITVSPTVTTTYTLTGNSGGCNGSAVKTVTVNSSLAISGNTLICAGKSTTLTVSGANTYTWSTAANGSSITVTPALTTTYSVSGSNAAGCISTASTIVNVNAVPVLTVSSSNTLICTGQSVTLSATGASTYSWSTAGSGSSITVSPVANTVYTVTGTGSNGCSSQLSYSQQVSPCTGIEAISGTVADQVYPNPFSNQLKLELSQAALITISNTLGQTLYSGQAESGLTSVDTRDLPAGVYYVEIRNEKRTLIKVVKH